MKITENTYKFWKIFRTFENSSNYIIEHLKKSRIFQKIPFFQPHNLQSHFRAIEINCISHGCRYFHFSRNSWFSWTERGVDTWVTGTNSNVIYNEVLKYKGAYKQHFFLFLLLIGPPKIFNNFPIKIPIILFLYYFYKKTTKPISSKVFNFWYL